MTIGRVLKQTADRWPDSEAVVDGSTRLTYRDLEERVARFATGLRSRGVEAGDGIGIFMANSLEQIVSYLAVQSIGAVAVPINPRLSAGELATILTDAEATTLICDGPRTDVVDRAANDLTTVEWYVSPRPRTDMASFDVVVADGVAEYPTVGLSLDDPALMMHTSGTTGRPKLVVIDHQGQLLNSMACAVELGFVHGDTALHVAPLSHSAGYLNLFLPCLQLGATHVLQSDFDPERTLARIKSEDITVSLGVPTHFQKLRETDLAIADTSSLRLLVTSGAPVTQGTAEWVRDHLCETFVNVYGLTETTGLVTMSRDVHTEGGGFCAGEPFLNVEVRLVDVGDAVPPDAKVDDGERGELVVRSPKVMQGYYRRPEQTEQTLRDGWLYTGDVAVKRDGTYYLVDRVDNRIISGGENIYPREVESVLEDHPDIVDVAVTGEPDPSLGEAVAAYVVSRDPALTLEDVDEFWKRRTDITDFKRPRKFTLVEAIPRNQSGKIRRDTFGPDGDE